MKQTIVGMVTPHALRMTDIANDAERGVNVQWHVRDAVSRTVADFGHQYNAQELLSAYIHGLQTSAEAASPSRKEYKKVLLDAASMAASELKQRFPGFGDA